LFKKIHVGMRTLKTSLSVMLIVLIASVTSIDPQISALSAVFSQRSDFSSSFTFGIRRTIAICCGAFASIVYIFLSGLLPTNTFTTALLAGVGIAITIQVSLISNNSAGIIGASATFLIIIFNIPGENQYVYALWRIFDTFLGAIIAVGVEYFLPRPRVLKWTDAYNRHVPKFIQIVTTDDDDHTIS